MHNSQLRRPHAHRSWSCCDLEPLRSGAIVETATSNVTSNAGHRRHSYRSWGTRELVRDERRAVQGLFLGPSGPSCCQLFQPCGVEGGACNRSKLTWRHSSTASLLTRVSACFSSCPSIVLMLSISCLCLGQVLQVSLGIVERH